MKKLEVYDKNVVELLLDKRHLFEIVCLLD